MRSRWNFLAPVAALCATAWASPAFATLGAGTASVMHFASPGLSHEVTSRALYDVHEGRGSNGLLIREYVDSSGRVFAVTWTGQQLPDLHELLGAYAERFTSGTTLSRTGHHVLAIKGEDFEADLVRLPRGWAGHAVLPSAIPAGVNRSELR
jgi:Protein of unknown function (DUF2844)